MGYLSTALCGVAFFYVFTALDSFTASPNSFGKPIFLNMEKPISTWPIEEFKFLPKQYFLILSNKIINDLSTDQYYAYRICQAVILGEIDSN